MLLPKDELQLVFPRHENVSQMRGECGAHFTQGEFPGSGAKHERQHARQKVSNVAKSNFAVAFNFKFTLLGPILPRIFAPQVLCLGNSKSEKGKHASRMRGTIFVPGICPNMGGTFSCLGNTSPRLTKTGPQRVVGANSMHKFWPGKFQE